MNSYLSFIITVFLFSSCSINNLTTTNNIPLPKNAKSLIKKVNTKQKNFKDVSLYANAVVTNDDVTQKLNVRIKSRIDSIICISVNGPFGIEIIRGMITTDSIYFMNRINKTYFIQPLSYLKQFTGVTLSFYDFQNIIKYNTQILSQDYDMELIKNGYRLISDNIIYNINKEYRISKKKVFHNKNSLELSFSNFNEKDNFHKKVEIDILGERKSKISLNYINIQFNNFSECLFVIPQSYYESK